MEQEQSKKSNNCQEKNSREGSEDKGKEIFQNTDQKVTKKWKSWEKGKRINSGGLPSE